MQADPTLRDRVLMRAQARRNIGLESDAAFAGKLVAVSFGAGALLKYGSLALTTPFHPDGLKAGAIVIIPVLAYTAWLIIKGSQTD